MRQLSCIPVLRDRLREGWDPMRPTPCLLVSATLLAGLHWTGPSAAQDSSQEQGSSERVQPEQQQPTIVGWEQLIGLIQQLRSNGYSDLRRIELQPPYVAVWARDRSGQWVALTLDESGNLRERQELTGPPRPATQGTEQARLRIRIGPLRLRLENLTIDVQAPLEEILRIVQDDQQGSGQEDSSGSQGRQ